ncbi:MAG: FecR family protein [Bacteroidales bacterium]
MNIRTKHIILYLEEGLSAEERQKLERELGCSEVLRKEFQSVASIWHMSEELKQHNKINTQGNWNEIASRIKKDKQKVNLFRIVRYVASIILLPLLAYSAYMYMQATSNEDAVVPSIQITSVYGTVTKTSLPDGTRVWLNSGSTLSYPQIFSENRRIVQLSGEAYFEVSSDNEHRFDVYTSSGLFVSAYGTGFNVCAYDDDDIIDVTLVEGNIDVSRHEDSLYCKVFPGKHLVYCKSSEKMSISDADLAVKVGWKDGKMIFRRASMTKVVQRLSRRFNVDIKLYDDELYAYEYSATFTTETLDEILQLLKKTAPIEYSIIEPKKSDNYDFTRRSVVISLRK